LQSARGPRQTGAWPKPVLVRAGADACSTWLGLSDLSSSAEDVPADYCRQKPYLQNKRGSGKPIGPREGKDHGIVPRPQPIETAGQPTVDLGAAFAGLDQAFVESTSRRGEDKPLTRDQDEDARPDGRNEGDQSHARERLQVRLLKDHLTE